MGIPDELLATYPNEMTIVLQHQFGDLEIGDDYFSVGLSFNNVRQPLVIPFDAMVAFADPSVRFGLQFEYEKAKAKRTKVKRTKRASEAKPPTPARGTSPRKPTSSPWIHSVRNSSRTEHPPICKPQRPVRV